MKPPAILENLPWRIAGLILLGVLVVAYQPDLDNPIHRLVIPIAMAVATWMLVQNAAAVALGAGLLAGIHGNPGSADWIVGIAYPALAALCAAIVAVVFWGRFRRRIAATHQQRWQNRRKPHDHGDRS
ncbi:MAG: hypothetical protein ACNA7W_17965 [Pseudomonadales bacterium]